MAKKKGRQWTWAPDRRLKPALPDDVKAEVQRKADELIEKHLKPAHVKPPPDDQRWNYLTGIHTKWYRSFFYLVGDYASPGPDAISPTFEERFARLRPAAGGKFDLSFMRHTGQWVELFQGQTLDECLREIRDDPWFMP